MKKLVKLLMLLILSFAFFLSADKTYAQVSCFYVYDPITESNPSLPSVGQSVSAKVKVKNICDYPVGKDYALYIYWRLEPGNNQTFFNPNGETYTLVADVPKDSSAEHIFTTSIVKGDSCATSGRVYAYGGIVNLTNDTRLESSAPVSTDMGGIGAKLYGYIHDSDGTSVTGARVDISLPDYSSGSYTTSSGFYEFNGLNCNYAHKLTATYQGRSVNKDIYQAGGGTPDLCNSDSKRLDLTLPAPTPSPSPTTTPSPTSSPSPPPSACTSGEQRIECTSSVCPTDSSHCVESFYQCDSNGIWQYQYPQCSLSCDSSCSISSPSPTPTPTPSPAGVLSCLECNYANGSDYAGPATKIDTYENPSGGVCSSHSLDQSYGPGGVTLKDHLKITSGSWITSPKDIKECICGNDTAEEQIILPSPPPSTGQAFAVRIKSYKPYDAGFAARWSTSNWCPTNNGNTCQDYIKNPFSIDSNSTTQGQRSVHLVMIDPSGTQHIDPGSYLGWSNSTEDIQGTTENSGYNWGDRKYTFNVRYWTWSNIILNTAGTYTFKLYVGNIGETNNNWQCGTAKTLTIERRVSSWIQASGDVHSNERIRASGGPDSIEGVICPTQAATPRVSNGLISAYELLENFGNTDGFCVVGDKATLMPYTIPTYEDLKSIYFTQSKANKTDATPASGTANQGTIRSALNSYDILLIRGNLDINGNLGGAAKTAVVFVDGDLSFGHDFTFGNANSGLVFVVKGNVNIHQDVTQIDAVIISDNKIYTAGAGCATSSVATTDPLVVNGSLISLNGSNNIKFCRTLSNNNNPAEKIIQQPKYLVILRNLFSQTYQKWKEIE